MAWLAAAIAYCALYVLTDGAVGMAVRIAAELRDAWGKEDEDDGKPAL